MVKVWEWLDKEYPKEIRSEIKELNISRKNLEGCLDLSEFINLEKLDCSFNNLYLQLKGCANLTELDCSYNQLVEKRFLKRLPSPQKLVKLNLLGNDFSHSKLDFDACHHFFNLLEFNGEKLWRYIVDRGYEWESLNKGLERLGEEMEKRENDLNKEVNFWKGKCEWYKNYDEFQSKLENKEKDVKNKEKEIKWLKENLKRVLGNSEYQAQIEAKYPLQFRK